MFNKRNIRIEAAISVFQLSVEHYQRTIDYNAYTDGWFEACRKAYHAMLKAKNELYDAIGGMEDYKYPMEED